MLCVQSYLLAVVELSLARAPPEVDVLQVVDKAVLDVVQQLPVDAFLQRERAALLSSQCSRNIAKV